MLFRNCAGGIVFSGEKVLLIKNDKDEWVMPKGVVREGRHRREVATERVRLEAGVEARVLGAAGETCYEFYSMTRRRPVCNRVQWYLMAAETDVCAPSAREGFFDGGFFDRDDALSRITYTQDRSLLAVAFAMYQEMRREENTAAPLTTAGVQM